MKFLHISDLHFSAKFVSLGRKAQAYRERIFQTFQNICSTAIKEKYDFLIITGDIFDNPYPSESEIDRFRQEVYKLSDNNILTFMIAGNHDQISQGSVWSKDRFQNDKNIIVFDNLTCKYSLSKYKADIFGLSIYEDNDLDLSGIRNMISQSKKEGRQAIVLLHGSVDMLQAVDAANITFKRSELEALGADYIGLGDWHSFLRISNNIYYAGSIEPLNISQQRAGFAVDVNIDPNGSIFLRERKFGSISFEKKDILLDKVASVEQLFQNLHSLENPALAMTLNFIGTPDFEYDTEELESAFADKFLFLKIIDDSVVDNSTIQDIILEEGTLMYEFDKLLREEYAHTGEVVFDKARKYGLKLFKD